MGDDSIFLCNYDPNSPCLAEVEIRILKDLFHGQDWVLAIQHIGSTSIPGLVAKPIIDIYIGARSIQEAQQAIEPIKKLGYQFWDENPNKEKLFFVKGMPPFGTGRTHHIHIVEYKGDYWKAVILFRDYMRGHPDEILHYVAVKNDLPKKHQHDREAYTDGKTDYVGRYQRLTKLCDRTFLS